jgi:hypothetical protein
MVDERDGTQLHVRIDDDLVIAIDAHKDALESRHHVTFSRNDVVVRLIRAGLRGITRGDGNGSRTKREAK